MLRFALFVIFVAVANAVYLPFARIVGGSEADILEAPYQVALLADFSGSGTFSIACGGSILSRSAVLSAAQCTDGTAAKKWKVRASSSTHSSGGQVIQVSSFKQHEEYNPRTLENDIVILYMSEDIVFSISAIPANLPTESLNFGDGADSLVTGWGKTTVGGATPDKLRKVTVQIIGQVACETAYNGIIPIKDTMVCAGRHGVGGADACQGDTGGPMVAAGILYGVSSWGVGCGAPQYPGVYTRVPKYRSWIDSNLLPV